MTERALFFFSTESRIVVGVGSSSSSSSNSSIV